MFLAVELGTLMSDWHDRNYDESHCWQYDIRVRNREEDLQLAGLTEADVAELTTDNFDIHYTELPDEKRAATAFIKRHEWLGNLGRFPTHYYTATYEDLLAGVVVFGVPNGGEMNTTRLIQRGACISWSPPNLASTFIMTAIKDMVDTTDYRVFTAYSDPAAMELGTIYQACNFDYIGLASTSYKYINPYTGRPVSDRFFRLHTSYRRYANELGIKWHDDWSFQRASGGGGMLWENVPSKIEKRLRDAGRAKQAEAERFEVPGKGRYVYVLGRTKSETRMLRREFLVKHHKCPYPKIRGENPR